MSSGLLDLTDSRGRKVHLSKKPDRVATSSLGNDEIALEILRRAGAPKRLIAVSFQADNPKYSNISGDIAHIPGRIGDDIEAVIKLRPDLVILADYNRPELVTRLEDAKITCFVLGGFSSLDDIAAKIKTIGRLLHEEKAANGLSADFRKSVAARPPKKRASKDATKGATPSPRIIGWSEGGSVLGMGTIFDDIVRAAGAKNLIADLGLTGWPKLSLEKLAMLRPDWIIVGGEVKEKDVITERIAKTPGWSLLPAVKKKRVIVVPNRWLWSASHHVAKALERIHNGIH